MLGEASCSEVIVHVEWDLEGQRVRKRVCSRTVLYVSSRPRIEDTPPMEDTFNCVFNREVPLH